MASAAKPWELDTEDPSDPRLADERQAKESDGLLTDKACQRHSSIVDGFDFSFGLKSFISNLEGQFGSKLLWLLFATQFLLKGFAFAFYGKAEPYLYKLYHVPAGQMQIFQGVTQIPWAMKPIIGLLSDICPINGYNKAPYMFATSFLGVAAMALVGASTPSILPVQVLVVCFILMQLQASTADLLSEAKYSEKMRLIPAHGPALMTYVWFGMQVGGLFAVVLSGVVIAQLGPHKVYLIAMIPAAAVLVPVMLNYMEEHQLSQTQIVEARSRFMAQGEAVVLCVLMLCGTISLTVLGLTNSDGAYVTAIGSIGVAFVVLVGFSVLLSPTIAKFNAFSLVQTSMTLSISGAGFYFYTDTPEQYPDGPHFSPFFYNSVVGVVSAVVSLFGIYCYQRYMSTWTYRNILLATNLAVSVMCLPDIVMFTRYNLKLGIPDHAFILGSTVAQQIIQQWQWMPQVVILANLCPKGMEATMYALLAGCHNLGNTIAANCGAVLLEWLNCLPSGQPDESKMFENLWKASLISSMLPIFTIVSIFWLVPDARQVDRIIEESDSATTGSLWRCWTGRDV